MMKTVWDFPLTLEPEQFIDLPTGSEPLTVQTHDSGSRDRPICLYALVCPSHPLCRRKVTVVDGGQPRCYVTREEYVGTVCVGKSQGYIAHVFLCGEEVPV